MNIPDIEAGEAICGDPKCGKLLRDMEGNTCLDCGAAPRYCADHLATNPCGLTQCLPCHENEICHCHICERIAREAQIEARGEF